MSSPPRPLYLVDGEDAVFATLHDPASGAARDTAVLLCPPFGWDEVCAYRSLRAWAGRLAAEGYPTLRLSYPSTGDSGGETGQPGRLAAWSGAVDQGAGWLRRQAGARRVAVVGMDFGALMALTAAAEGALIDDLVLWGCPAGGRAFVRQLRAFSRLEYARFFEDLPQPDPLPDGELEAGGFRLTAATMADLSGLDLAALSLPPDRDPGRRVLLLDRDGLSIPKGLAERLGANGAEVSVAGGRGFGIMTSHPQTAQLPIEVVETVSAWLRSAASEPSRRGSAGPLAEGAQSSVEILVRAGAHVRETPRAISAGDTDLACVVVEPVEAPPRGPCLVLLNAGAVRRIGPSRLWVQVARRWAVLGIRTVRVDMTAIGDSEGDESAYATDGGLYVPEMVPRVLSVLNQLASDGIGDRFVLGGLCAGAYWAFHAALEDPRIDAVLMINPRALIWDVNLAAARDLRAALLGPAAMRRIRRNLTPGRVAAIARWLASAPLRALRGMTPTGRIARRAKGSVDAALSRFQRSSTRALLLFSEREPLEAELRATGRLDSLQTDPRVMVEHIQVSDHTLRPVWAQQEAERLLDAAIKRELSLTR